MAWGEAEKQAGNVGSVHSDGIEYQAFSKTRAFALRGSLAAKALPIRQDRDAPQQRGVQQA